MTDLISEALPQYAPTTNHYKLDDGRYVLITVPDADIPLPAVVIPIISGIKVAHVEPRPTEVFLCDEHAVPIDADGDPANGLTPLATYPAGTDFTAALAALGYDLLAET